VPRTEHQVPSAEKTMHPHQLKYNHISDLNDFHDFFDMRFTEHQKSLMNRKLPIAYCQLKDLYTLLLRHLAIEEKILLPEYKKQVVTEPPGGAVRYYIREHRQIKRQMDDFVKKLAVWQATLPAKIELVHLFDTHVKFKELLDHHDARERVFLYRILDQQLESAYKNNLMQKIKIQMEGNDAG
jgi:hypothetical protein